jgi:hypothetical protein
MTKPFLLISAQFAPALLSILDPRPSTLDQALLFIELTDHLRCPNDHDESFLVLLPDLM